VVAHCEGNESYLIVSLDIDTQSTSLEISSQWLEEERKTGEIYSHRLWLATVNNEYEYEVYQGWKSSKTAVRRLC
jgi:hypothetical protein